MIELLLVMLIMGLLMTMAAPRLAAFLPLPEDRELRTMEHFFLRGSRIALREPLVPASTPDAKPLRIKIVPPDLLILLRADTELVRMKLGSYKIESVEQDGIPTPPEPEFSFNALGQIATFKLTLSGASRMPGGAAVNKRLWRINRLGVVRWETVTG